MEKGHYASQLESANAQIRELYDRLLHKEAMETLLVNTIEEFGVELTQIGDDIAQGKHTMTGVDTEARAGPAAWAIHPTTFVNLRNLCTKVEDRVLKLRQDEADAQVGLPRKNFCYKQKRPTAGERPAAASRRSSQHAFPIASDSRDNPPSVSGLTGPERSALSCQWREDPDGEG